jgi:TM2 domain-containing membrane protein YozV
MSDTNKPEVSADENTSTEKDAAVQAVLPTDASVVVPQGASTDPPPPQPQPSQPQSQPQASFVPPQQSYTYADAPQQDIPQQGYPYTAAPPQSRWQGLGSAQKEKWVAAVLAFFLGYFGIHKFYLGYKNEGIIMLVVTLVGAPCFFLGPAVMGVIALIEAVKYLILTQEEFERTYVQGLKGWF